MSSECYLEKRIWRPPGSMRRKDAQWYGKPVTVEKWFLSLNPMPHESNNGGIVYAGFWYGYVLELKRQVPAQELLEMKR